MRPKRLRAQEELACRAPSACSVWSVSGKLAETSMQAVRTGSQRAVRCAYVFLRGKLVACRDNLSGYIDGPSLRP